MRNFYYTIDPRDFQKFQGVAEAVASRLGDFFTEVTKNVNADTQQREGSTRGAENTSQNVHSDRTHKSDVKVRIDVAEDDTSVYVYAELPGIAREDVGVTITEDRILTIKGNKRRLHDDALNVLRAERGYGEFARTITIEQEIKTDSISATFRDGVLTVTLPKTEAARPKTVNINIQ